MPSVIDYGICAFKPSCTINLNFCTKTIKLFRYWLPPWTMGEAHFLCKALSRNAGKNSAPKRRSSKTP